MRQMILSSAKSVGSTFADVTYSMPLGCRPGAFLFSVVVCWNKRTINRECVQEIMKVKNPRHKNDEDSSMFFHNVL